MMWRRMKPQNYDRMPFSYSKTMDAWVPSQPQDDKKIRVIELEPLVWYLRWLPRSWHSCFQLHTTLVWEDIKADSISRKPYKTLSYTWGDLEKTDGIIVNGSKLKITASLALALHHLREGDQPLRIWIDQICIDQEHHEEKAEQVGYMDRIYRLTEETLVWLGPAADDSDMVMDLFSTIGAFAEGLDLLSYYHRDRYHMLVEIERNTNPDDPKTQRYQAFCNDLAAKIAEEFFEALIAFYRRPWFYRAWVLQEFALPPKVTLHCGNKRIQAEEVMVVTQIIRTTISSRIVNGRAGNDTLRALVNTMIDMNTLHPFFSCRQRRKARDEGRTEGDNIYHILHWICVEHSMRASQGCDLIYGTLALSNDAKGLGIKTDYSEENAQIQTAKAYIKTARAIIAFGRVDLLISAQHTKKDDMLPSWVPDWRCEIMKSFAWVSEVGAKPIFNASGDQKVEISELQNDRLLSLQGYIVDGVEELGGPWIAGLNSASSITPEDYITYLAQVRMLCLISKSKGNSIYPTNQRRDEAVWRIPVGDTDQDESWMATRATHSTQYSYKHCLAQLDLQMQEKNLQSLDEYNHKLAELETMRKELQVKPDTTLSIGNRYRMRMKEMRGKRPFLTKIGYVGMGPSCIRTGDQVAVLCGGSVPFVIRPLGDGKFRFLGECYVDTIMDGEIVTTREKKTIVLL